MTEENSAVNNKSAANSKKASNENSGCIYCGVCPHTVAEYYDLNRDLQPAEFIEKKLICKKCTKKITNEYDKNKKDLVCSTDYYIDLHYGVELQKQKYLARTCTHVKDKELLIKQLDIIYQDFDALVAKRENKEK